MQRYAMRSVIALLVALAAACSGGGALDISETAPTSTSSPVATEPTRAEPATEATTEASTGEPAGMIALGHSGVTGESDPDRPGVATPESSWATGTDPAVSSIYQRLVAEFPDYEGLVANTGTGGATADRLPSQAAAALARVPAPALAIIQTIDNDIRCDGTDPGHVAEFGESVREVITTILDVSPDSTIVMVQQTGRPAGYAAFLQEVGETRRETGSGMCHMFDPGTGALNTEHVATLTSIIEAYETEQARVCAEFPRCFTDGGATTDLTPPPEFLTADFNHLVLEGQAWLAEAFWPVVQDALGLPVSPETADTRPSCPNPDGGSQNLCLGPLVPGEYSTVQFEPTITYTVPEGWSNMEDLPGNFLLIPPGGSLAGVDPGTSDYIGVYTSIAAPLECGGNDAPDPNVATTVSAYVDWLQHQPSLIVSEPRPITVGGMTGIEVDASINTDHACPDPDLGAYAFVLIGNSPSSLLHSVLPDYPLRLNLFDRDNGTIFAIEMADAPNGGSDFADWWTAAAEVVQTFAIGA